MGIKKVKKVDPKSSDEIIEMFDKDEDVSDYMNTQDAVFRVNVDFPTWMVKDIDREARRVGVNRQALIKMWIDERLKAIR